MKKFKEYFDSLNKFEKVIYIISFIPAILGIVFVVLALANVYSNSLNFVELFLSINIFLNGFIKFKEHKILSIIEFIVGVVAFVAFLVI